MRPLLEISQLTMNVPGPEGPVQILHGIDLLVREGECVALVGESGSGKSMTAKSIIRMLPSKADQSGTIHFKGRDVLSMSPAETTALRQQDVSMIYQDPRAATNPMQRIDRFLTEGVVCSRQLTREEALARAIDLMHAVHLSNPERLIYRYPHELSGGMLQRILIVAALMNSPALLLSDESTSALDVTNQAEVVAILDELRRSEGLGLLFITHDLDLAAAISDRIAVMFRGRIVEEGPAEQVVGSPSHVYTRALLAARPRLEGPPKVRLRSVTETMSLEVVDTE